MKTATAMLAFVLTTTFALSAVAQESIAGSWQVETVSGAEPPESASLALLFGDDNKATVTYTLAGEAQTWQYTYAVVDGQLLLDPIVSYGEPQTVTYDIKFNEGKLQLLTPKPGPVEEEGEDAQDEEPADEEDNRTPVWVLFKA